MNITKLNMKLSSQPCKLHKCVLFEKPNLEVLDKLINSDLLKDTFHCKQTGKVYQNEKQQLIALRDSIDKKTGLLKVTYKKANGIDFGRVFAFKALAAIGLRREIRNSLFYHNMVDIDVDNCHPELCNQLCIANGIQNKYLNEYVTNRSQLLVDVQKRYNVDRDSAKTLFIILLYFGSFERWAKEHNITDKPSEFIVNFKTELALIGDTIIKENIQFKKAVIKI
jgi:hypothetical protein